MADKASLRILGMTYGGITALVMLVAGFVILMQPDEWRVLADTGPAAITMPAEIR